MQTLPIMTKSVGNTMLVIDSIIYFLRDNDKGQQTSPKRLPRSAANEQRGLLHLIVIKCNYIISLISSSFHF